MNGYFKNYTVYRSNVLLCQTQRSRDVQGSIVSAARQACADNTTSHDGRETPAGQLDTDPSQLAQTTDQRQRHGTHVIDK